MQVKIKINGKLYDKDVEPRLLLTHFIRRCGRPDRHPRWLRNQYLRRLYGPGQWARGKVVHDIYGSGRRRRRRHDRRYV